MERYEKFISAKLPMHCPSGHEPAIPFNSNLFEYERDIVRWACRIGRAAIFADCGLGKTIMQLEWARHVCSHTGGDVLILAPLAVAHQTKGEAAKFGIDCPVTVARDQSQVAPGINVVNYEMLHRMDAGHFAGVVLDESSILKDYTGATRNQIIESFSRTPYRLSCTATPAPNDHMELGNHSEFLGAMPRTEMLAHFFVHDGGDTAKWRLKRHASKDYWAWVCSWAVMLRKPSDLGYSDDGFALPPLTVQEKIIECDAPSDGFLFPMDATDLMSRRRARRDSISERCRVASDMANNSDEPWLIWCDLNAESTMVSKAIPDAVEVTGSDSMEAKESRMAGFSTGRHRVLVSKPSIAGHGMNWQHCRNVIFLGLSDSYEAYYQAIRRCWRFGQKKEVNAYVIISRREGSVLDNIKRKEKDADAMLSGMVQNMKDLNRAALGGAKATHQDYAESDVEGDSWRLMLGDCVTRIREVESESVGYSIFSPPFASLYTYSASERDMGNCAGFDEFEEHFGFLVPELYRVTMPGRCLSFHCMNLPHSKERDGFIGLRDFRGILIRLFQSHGWIFHSEVCIWKDPVTSMHRTKAIGLLHKQLVKDSCISRQGVPDYLVTMRKPGDNPRRVSGELEHYCGDDETLAATLGKGNRDHMRDSINIWQRYASPVWMDIRQSNTLQRESARAEEDERHICPLQLDVIERGLQLWSMPNDLVLSPFAGIGSEGYVAVKMGRRFVGIELKPSYFTQAELNLKAAEATNPQGLLFHGGME